MISQKLKVVFQYVLFHILYKTCYEGSWDLQIGIYSIFNRNPIYEMLPKKNIILNGNFSTDILRSSVDVAFDMKT